MSERARISFLSILWLIALGIVAFSAVNMLQAVKAFQQENTATKAGDVNTLRPWMTIPVVSRVYHVPEDYLDRSLQINKTDPLHRATLYEIAARKSLPIDRFIYTLKQIILTYRKEHPTPSSSLLLLRSCITHPVVPRSGETNA